MMFCLSLSLHVLAVSKKKSVEFSPPYLNPVGSSG